MFAAMIAAVCCSGCNAAETPPQVSAAVDGPAQLMMGGTEYRCHVSYVSTDTACVETESPQNVCGMTVKRSGGNYTVSLGSLLCRCDGAPPDGSVAGEIFSALDAVNNGSLVFIGSSGEADSRLYEFSGKTDSESFTIVCDSDGSIKRIQSESMTMHFV